MAEPTHLAIARSLIGTIKDGPQVPQIAREIGQSFPDMASYCAQASATTSWCGIFIALCLLRAYRTRPPFNPGNELLSFMWVDAWEDSGWGTSVPQGQEQPGDILVFRSPHHITFFVADEGDRYRCIGGNQSDGVTETTFAKSGLRAIRRAPAAGAAQIVQPPASSGKRFTNIKATVFNDTQLAYGPKPADFMGYSLPGRITGELPLRITNRTTGLSAIANKCDVGPWYDGRPGWPEDRWWETGARPRAETDPRTNGAGIDLYPALARAIGVEIVERNGRIVAGEAQVDVEIISEIPMAEAPAAQQPVNIQIDWARIEQFAETIAKIADAMEKRQSGQAPAALPAPSGPVIDVPATPAPAVAAPSSLGGILSLALPIVSKALPMLGLQGGIWGTVAMLLGQAANVIGPATGPAATPTGTSVAAGLGGIFASGLAGLVSRFLNRNKTP